MGQTHSKEGEGMDGFPRFQGTVLLVEDPQVSRRFYEDLLGMRLVTDYGGVCLGFEGNLSLWANGTALPLLGEPRRPHGGRDMELYFETPDLEVCAARLEEAGVPWVHPLREQPWGQRCLRVEDPDGNLVEVAEPLESVVRRLASQGWEEGALAAKTYLSPEEIRRILGS